MKLFTPGPLSTSSQTRQQLLDDWATRDAKFEQLTQQVIAGINHLYTFSQGDDADKTCVMLQGPSTFALEATIRTLISPDMKVLALSNGVYGDRLYQLATRAGLNVTLVSVSPLQRLDARTLGELAVAWSDYDVVTCVHCETSSGVLNDLQAISDVVAASGAELIIDAVSTFGAYPFDALSLQFSAMIGSANKCIESVPGVTFAMVDKNRLIASKGRSDSVSFDLYEQWHYTRKKGQWRFTPPTQVIAALHSALTQLNSEGGPQARYTRYQQNFATIQRGFESLGFKSLVDSSVQSPIIVGFLMEHPSITHFDFECLYNWLKNNGMILYPGALQGMNYFRVGCIGHLTPVDADKLVTLVSGWLEQQGANHA